MYDARRKREGQRERQEGKSEQRSLRLRSGGLHGGIDSGCTCNQLTLGDEGLMTGVRVLTKSPAFSLGGIVSPTPRFESFVVSYYLRISLGPFTRCTLVPSSANLWWTE